MHTSASSAWCYAGGNAPEWIFIRIVMLGVPVCLHDCAGGAHAGAGALEGGGRGAVSHSLGAPPACRGEE